MNYLEAKDTLLGFKFVTRKTNTWSDMQSYLLYVPTVSHFLKLDVLGPKGPELKPWAATIEDTCATDWEAVEPATVKMPYVDPEVDLINAV